jgi:LysM repeat protein
VSSRTRPLASRPLIGLLLVCIAIASIFYFNRTRASEAAEPSASSESAGVGGDATASARPASPALPGTAPQPPAVSLANPAAPATRPTQPPPQVIRAAPPSGFLAAAAAKRDAGDLVAARKIANDALLSKSLAAADLDATRQFLGELNAKLVFSPQIVPNDVYVGKHVVQPGESLQKIATQYDIPWESIARINNVADPRRIRAGQSLKVLLGPIHGYVRKGSFDIELWFGEPYSPTSMFIRSFRVGLGTDGSTPTGKWLVTAGEKLKNPTWTNPREAGVVIPGGDPKNPLGTRWIALTGIDGGAVGQLSYGIHGTIEPHTIGTNSSMGCVRLLNEEVELVYDLLRDGKSTVTVVE